MELTFTPRLREHIQAKGRHGIIVEVAQCDNSDL